MNLTILYNSTVKFKQTMGRGKIISDCFCLPSGLCFAKAQTFSCRPIYLNFRSPRIWPFLMISIFCLWEKYTCFNTFLSLSLKNSSSILEATAALDFRMTTPWSSHSRFVETQTASVLFSDYVCNQNSSYHSFYRNIRERIFVSSILNWDQILMPHPMTMRLA